MSETVVLADGWQSVTNMIDSAKLPMMGIGVSLLVLIGIWVAMKIGAAGKGKAREAFQDIAVWVLAGVMLGAAVSVPQIASSVGVEIGNSSTGAPPTNENGTVEGQ